MRVYRREKAVRVYLKLALIVAAAIPIVLTAASVRSQETQNGDYIIGAEDVLEVNVWNEERLTREVLVRTDGRISLPLINDIQAAGRTPVELADAVAEKLRDYITDPHVSVIVKVPRDYKFYVLGNVNRPGPLALKKRITFLQAIAMAGGLNEWASKKIILISKQRGAAQTRRIIDYKDVISGEDLKQNIFLQDGDTIVVP
jgi:polysaccharide export outer membrane protein